MALKDTWVDKVDGEDINSAEDINSVAQAVIGLEKREGEAKNGVTFIPNVSSAGIISWTNDGGLANPNPVNINGKSAYAYAKDSGYTGTEAEFAKDINPDNMKVDIAEILKEEVPLVKVAEQPTFVNSVDEMTDTSKVYVMPDGYFYRYKESENYNLLKISEVTYNSRLQDDAEGIVSSSEANAVTGWMPVTYGKYYTLSAKYLGTIDTYIGKRVTSFYPSSNPETLSFIRRINGLKADGTVVVYGSNINTTVLSDGAVLSIPDADVVAVQIHFYYQGDTISANTISNFEFMFVEGDTAQKAYDKSVNSKYADGDAEVITEWYNTGLAYNQPADYEGRVIELETDVTELKESVAELEENMQDSTPVSPYYRNVNFGVLPSGYYKGLDDTYSDEGFTRYDTTYATFIETWKSLVANHSSYVTETELGTASDGQPIYLYDLKPVRISNQDKDIPKIIIIAGQHGGEMPNVYGLYYFVKNLLNKWNKHSALEYLRNNAELMIVPVLNTYGWDNQSYKNANGVNLNRNYNSNWVLVEDTASLQYGGAKPFDQPETQIVRDLLLNNLDAVLVVDSHTNGGGVVSSYSDINYYGISTSTDDYFNRMVDAVAHNLSAISANFNLDYELEQPDTILGFLNHSDGTGILRDWVRDQNIVSALVEGFGGFPDCAAFTAEVYKANEEIIANWLITALNFLAINFGDDGEKYRGETGKSAYEYAQEGGYTGTESEFAEKLAFLMGYSLFGYVDENNNIVLIGNLADGTYTLKYGNEDGTYIEVGTLEIGAIPEPEVMVNVLDTAYDTDLKTVYNGIGYKQNARISISGGGEVTSNGNILTGLIPLGNDGDVFHIRGIEDFAAVSGTYIGYYSCWGESGNMLTTGSMPAYKLIWFGTDENGDTTLTMTHSELTLPDGTVYIRFQFGLPTGEVIITRNQLITE